MTDLRSLHQMLVDFGAQDLREGTRAVDSGDLYVFEDYIEVPVAVLAKIQAALCITPSAGGAGAQSRDNLTTKGE